MKGNLVTMLLACCGILLTQTGYSQTGTIVGYVKDSVLNEHIQGVSILIEGSKKGTSTDSTGKFVISGVDPGSYTIVASFVGYKTIKLGSVRVEEDSRTELEINLESGTGAMDEVVVMSTRGTNTQRAVIQEIRTANQVISGVSQQQIKLSQDRNAAQVMSRIPGVTVVDGRFIMVRGIPERYNQVLLNNAIAPSTEVDRRTFSFDLIPSNVLDRMLIYKSGAPENTGDFAGGLIKVFTSNAKEENFLSISASAGYRQGTTGKDFIQSKGSGTDFLGFDNGYRRLSSDFPAENLRSLPNRSQQRADAANLLKNNFAPIRSTAAPDFGAGANWARYWTLGNKTLSTLSAVNYSQSQMSYSKRFNRYLEQTNPADPVDYRFDYLDDIYEKENKIGVISNWLLKLNAFNKIEFKNLFNQIGENHTVLRSGQDFIQGAGLERKNAMYQYRSRTVYSGQVQGTHNFSESSSSLVWVVGANYLGEKQPDLRRFRTIETSDKSGVFRMILPPSSNLYDAGRFFGGLGERGVSQGLNYEKKFNSAAQNPVIFKAGYLVDYRTRNFDTRYFSYFYPGSSSLSELQRLELLHLSQIFAPENVKVNDGFLLEEGTRASDGYTASNFLTAGYAGVIIPVGDLNISGGLRAEYNIQKLNTSNDAGRLINVNNKVLSPLAFLNLDYEINRINKLRFAYYRSVNRPEFRELAPFLFYDYEFDAEKYGNPDLKTAKIENLDLRYEIYPRDGETISFGAFYKYFNNPIETRILIRSESPAFSFQNAESAYDFGLEFELRKSLKGLTGSRFLDMISMNLNASYIISQVDYGVDATLGQDAKRPLQGQSPYIINAALGYSNPRSGWQVNAAYNIFGKRIYAVGSNLFPTIYELPRHAADITVTKQLYRDWSVKLGVQDLFNARYRFYQDTNRDNKVDMKHDNSIFSYRRGTLVNASVTYTIK
ncbi:MAG: carboxypeptidase-like regulatory domain-containing protein [Chitinophagaceae bacterium]|nr:carboxypeptidase-like regulatory domain-containing protein [Chitinophagaceae bacterium]MCW5927271.1 carboxypeptidase-like regulatory domain-containing protein [Chitinophagaceae bacterium]